MATMRNSGAPTIEALNELLRGELAAVETYDKALDRLEDDELKGQLESCRASHQDRAERLREMVAQLGGQPADTSGVWGAFTRFLEGGATLLGDRATLAMLEEGEDHGLREYEENLEKLDVDTRIEVTTELMPAQVLTHEMLSTLKEVVR
ncbi:MAG: PA2169 family four-helix-bundle protein [Myxococcales bacterium]|nr:PA2169 family four-helix-bundle protein [Myxococcales bacterium]